MLLLEQNISITPANGRGRFPPDGAGFGSKLEDYCKTISHK